MDYKFGKIDGVKVALIGVPIDEVRRVRISGEEHTFEQINDDEINDSKYVVYIVNGIPTKLLDKDIEKIRNKRNKENDSDTYTTVNEFLSNSFDNKPLVKKLKNPNIL